MIQACVDEIAELLNNDDANITEKMIQLGRKLADLKNQKLKLKNLLATIAKCEMLEVIFQIILTITLLSMNHWKVSLTETELQGFFNADLSWFLAWTMPLLAKKILTTIMKVMSASKNDFAPMFGVIIYSVNAFIAVSVRITSIVIYFSVPLGLFNILTHWVYETVNVTWREYDESGSPVKFSIYDSIEDQYEIVEIKDIAPRLLTNEHYAKYTGLTLQMYYALFVVGIFVHVAVVFLLDMVSRQHYRQRSYVTTISGKPNNNKKIDLEYPEPINETNLEHWNWFVSFIHSHASPNS